VLADTLARGRRVERWAGRQVIGVGRALGREARGRSGGKGGREARGTSGGQIGVGRAVGRKAGNRGGEGFVV